jgi:putative phosphoesterase
MKIGLLSDTHNDQRNVKQALTRFRQEAIKTVLHAGDITNVKTLRLFEGFDLYVVRGNMDHDPGLRQAADSMFGLGRFKRVHRFTLDGAQIAMTHGDNYQEYRQLIESQRYEYVIRGHTHRRQDEKLDETRVINPGALKHPRWQSASCAILNTATGDLTWVMIT